MSHADRYADRFGARVWIHADDRDAADYATDLIYGTEPSAITAIVPPTAEPACTYPTHSPTSIKAHCSWAISTNTPS